MRIVTKEIQINRFAFRPFGVHSVYFCLAQLPCIFLIQFIGVRIQSKCHRFAVHTDADSGRSCNAHRISDTGRKIGQHEARRGCLYRHIRQYLGRVVRIETTNYYLIAREDTIYVSCWGRRPFQVDCG